MSRTIAARPKKCGPNCSRKITIWDSHASEPQNHLAPLRSRPSCAIWAALIVRNLICSNAALACLHRPATALTTPPFPVTACCCATSPARNLRNQRNRKCCCQIHTHFMAAVKDALKAHGWNTIEDSILSAEVEIAHCAPKMAPHASSLTPCNQ